MATTAPTLTRVGCRGSRCRGWSARRLILIMAMALAPAPTAAALAKRKVAKEKSLEAKRAHQATLREQEEQRVAQLEEQAKMRKLAERIARGE